MALFELVALLLVYHAAAEEYYNIAHMANTIHAVDWAIQEGANAVEFDLEFYASGQLRRFYHGTRCDCTCRCPSIFSFLCSNDRFVCKALRHDSSNPCNAEAPVNSLLAHTATKSAIALVYIDSKIQDRMTTRQKQAAGRNVVRTVTTQLFRRGYGGNVIIGAFKEEHLSYVQAAVSEVSSSPYKHKIFFALERGSLQTFPEWHALMQDLPTRNIIFGTGESSCSPRPHSQTTLDEARINKIYGTISMAYTWTDDAESTIEHNLNYVQGIITNFPSTVRDVLQRTGRQLATQSSTIPAATSGVSISRS